MSYAFQVMTIIHVSLENGQLLGLCQSVCSFVSHSHVLSRIYQEY